MVSRGLSAQKIDIQPVLGMRRIAPLLLVIVALGLTTGLLFFTRFHDFFSSDSYSYMTAAQNLATGRGFTNAAGLPEVIRTPGYPLLLVPFLWLGVSAKGVVVVQHLLRVAIILGTAAVAYRLTASRLQTAIAGLVVCLDVPTLDTANTILTETLFTVVLGIVLWSLWNAAKESKAWWWSVVPGLFAGTATLIRPAGLFFCIPAAAYLLLARTTRKLRSAVCFLVVFACPLLLWALRNYSQTGSFVLFPISAWNLLGYRAAGALAINDSGDFEQNFERRQVQLVQELCHEMEPRHWQPCLPLIAPQPAIPEKSAYYMSLGRKIVLEHPLAYVRLALRGSALIMLGDDAYRLVQLTGLDHRSAARILLIYTVPALCLAFLGARKYWRSDRLLFILLVLTWLYFVGITAGAEGYSRYRVPIMPVYAILIAAGVELIAARVFRGHRLGAS